MTSLLTDLQTNGFAISTNVFNKEDIVSLNEMASALLPTVGTIKDKGWYNWMDVEELAKTHNLLTEVDWSYFWSHTPQDNVFINETILPVLKNITDQVLDGADWGWQATNRYIMSNYKHDMPPSPHLDAPYLWPQKLDCQMAKYLDKGPLSLTFMIPLISFTPENGSTGFVPGTHKYIYDTANWNEAKPHTRTFFNDNYVQPSVPLGGFSCFYGNCMHSVMPNKTDDIRRAIIFRAIRQDALDEMERLGLG